MAKLTIEIVRKCNNQLQAEHEFSNKSSLIRRGGICIFVDEEEAEIIEQRPRGITFAAVPSPLPKCPLCGADISSTTGTTANATATANADSTIDTTVTTSSKRSIHEQTPDLGQRPASSSSSTRFWHKRTAAVTACWQQSKNRKRRFKTGCSHCGATGESCRISPPLLPQSLRFALSLPLLSLSLSFCLSQLQHLSHCYPLSI